MELLNKLFGKPTAKAPAIVDRGHFSNFSQQDLNNLASLLPMKMDFSRDTIRSLGKKDTVVYLATSESEVSEEIVGERLVQSLTDSQYKELREIQEIFRLAVNAGSNGEKLKLYLQCVERAPWHCYALKSAGVCYYMIGDNRRACDYLKRAVELSPDDENIRTNYQRIRRDV